MAKKNEIISPGNAMRAHRRRLPAVIKEINARIRDGHRLFMVRDDYPIGLYPFVLEAFKAVKGWEVVGDDCWCHIRIKMSSDVRACLL